MLLTLIFVLNAMAIVLMLRSWPKSKVFRKSVEFFRGWYSRRYSEQEVPRLLESVAQGIRAGLNTEGALKRVAIEGVWRSECDVLLSGIVSRLNSGVDVASTLLYCLTSLPLRPEFLRLRQALASLASMQRSGGDTVRMLSDAAEGVRGAVFLRRRAKALSAQMKLQAVVISSAPFLVVVILSIVSPSSLSVFGSDFVGRCLAFVCVILNVAGIYFLSKIARSWSR